jgi:hypothetical protein
MLSANFWPLFWAVIGAGAALTVLLSLLAATAPLPRRHRRPQLTAIEEAPRYPEETSQRMMATTGSGPRS